MQALGVAGANSWSPSSTWPMLAGFTQSRSFTGAIALNTVFCSTWASIGMSARMPCTAGSALSLAMSVEDLGLAGARRERVVEVLEAHRAGVLLDLAAVELRAAVLAHQDGGDAGLDALGRELRDLGLDLFADLLGDRLAVDDLCCHGCSLSCAVVRG